MKRTPANVNPVKKLFIILFWGVVGLGVWGAIQNKESKPAGEKTLAEQGIYLDSTASYAETDSQVGCSSVFSDDKKENLFNANYRNRWMEWKGEITLLEAGEMSLNVDGHGIQDLSVKFEDPSAGYDLKKGSVVTVKFLMIRAGGCFLPFAGERARVVNWPNS
ncbi:hypothetical protein [Metapseudomonas otitidis]|uniref:hypothetical protein n=1 Tax=Metapseudomonas otitidis TaxID=319939 RepID=UPI0013F5F614|nr:hypothetical protein [Pseudomonas otitidis]